MNNYMGGISSTKRSITDYLILYSGCSDIETVDYFDTVRTRHICNGIKQIVLLDQTIIPVPTNKGVINVGVFFCNRCRKLIVDKSSMEVI